MREFKKGSLHSGKPGKGKGKKVKTRAQAIAIGLSQERKMGKKVKPPPRGSAAYRREMAKRY